MPAPDRAPRGYELAERIGEGSFGVVFRARQAVVGREVAVKVIRPELADQPEFVRRFELEAQLVARLEHPHVVPLYDYWREPGAAYLVMRWLKGGSVRDLLTREGTLDPDTALRVLSQVAGALDAAHGRGVVHRDLKPANLLLDEAGNAYLSDFGIAKELAAASELTETGATPGVPAYVSPEQVRGEPVTPLADLYALGIVLFELLTGAHPYAGGELAGLLFHHLHDPLPPLGKVRPGLPGALDGVLARATAKRPADRFPDASTLLDAFREALEPGTTTADVRPPAPSRLHNPYKGLQAFAEADAADFFGREALTARLLERLRDGRFVAVVGPSGSGKSSVVRAGLVPALRRGGLAGSADWFVAEMVPGGRPFHELETALRRVAVSVPDAFAGLLAADPAALMATADGLLPQAGSELLLVVDQLEELFTLVDDPEERDAFLACLVAAATAPNSRLRVVVTLRADFYDRPLLHPEFGELVRAGTETVLPLTSDELERAVSRPAERVGVVLEPGLLAEIVAEVSAQPAALPLLQYALTELFDQRQGHILTLAAHRELGGVSGALARRAEDLHEDLDDAGRDAARQVLLRLVTLGEGTEDTRRRVPRGELTALPGTGRHADRVLDRFGAARLLSFDRDPDTRAPTVEVAHEALLREWGRLRRWIDDSRDELRHHRLLAQGAADWDDADRDPGLLLRGSRLAQLEAWAAETDLELTPAEHGYLDASLEARRRAEEEETARRAREAALERRSLLRLRALVAVLAAAALVASGLTVFAFDQRGDARREARVATARELAAAAVANLEVDPERSILLALEAVETTRSVDGTVLKEAEEALHRAVLTSRAVLTLPGSFGAAFSPDGTRLAISDEEGNVVVHDVVSGAEVLTIRGHEERVIQVEFTPDGSRLVTSSEDGTARVWDADTGGPLGAFTGHEDAVFSMNVAPDGTLAATRSHDGTVRVWDIGTGEEVTVLEVEGGGLHFSPDGTRLAVAAVGARVFDVRSGEELHTVAEGQDVGDVRFSPDGTRLAVATGLSTVLIFDADTGEPQHTLFGHGSWVETVDFNPDGTVLASGSLDGTVRLWDPDDGRPLMVLSGQGGAVEHVTFSPDGSLLVGAGTSGSTKVWDVSPEGAREVLTISRYGLFRTGLSADGSRIVSANFPLAIAHVFDARTGEEVLTLEGHEGPVGHAAFSPDGSRIATASFDGTARIWDARDGRELHALAVHEAGVMSVAFSPDGSRLATASFDGVVRIWHVERAALVSEFDHPEVLRAVFSPDGARLASSGNDEVVRIWDLAGETESETLEGHTNTVFGLAFSPDGASLATASIDGTFKVWDVAAGEKELSIEAHPGGVEDVAFSPDGARLASSGDDGTVRVWDLASGVEILALTGEPARLTDVMFTPDGSRLVVAGNDQRLGWVRVHALFVDELVEIARERLTRRFTEEECRQYLRAGSCPAT